MHHESVGGTLPRCLSAIVAGLRGVRRSWSRHPWLVAGLASLCLLMVFSGPVACITHCLLLDSLHQPHLHTHQHSTMLSSAAGNDPCVGGHSGDQLPIHDPPSALTIAVIAPPIVVAALTFVARLQPKLQQIARDVWQPPPDKPPRLSPASL